MGWIYAVLSGAWRHRVALMLAAQLASKLWKSAQDFTREYIRFRVKQKLKRQVTIIALELLALLCAAYLSRAVPGDLTLAIASLVLWTVTLYNAYDLFFLTIPELQAVYRALRGRVGYTLRHILQVSIATELMEWNVIFLGICLFLGLSSRTYLALAFSYTRPWADWIRALT